MEFFIEPGQNLNDHASLDWQHFANLSKNDIKKRWYTSAGTGLLSSLKKVRFARAELEQAVGKFSGKYDLRGIPLQQIDLTESNLSDIDFFAADLSHGNFRSADFSGSHLSECNIKGADFEWAKFNGALLDNVAFDYKTNFLGVDLHEINFTLAALLRDLALSQQRIQQLQQYYPVFAWFLRITCDYGRAFSRYMIWVGTFIFFYAAVYCYLLDKTFLDSLYFSTVTFATVGYGDILPVTILDKLVVISEIIIGYLMGGLLIAILAKRVIG